MKKTMIFLAALLLAFSVAAGCSKKDAKDDAAAAAPKTVDLGEADAPNADNAADGEGKDGEKTAKDAEKSKKPEKAGAKSDKSEKAGTKADKIADRRGEADGNAPDAAAKAGDDGGGEPDGAKDAKKDKADAGDGAADDENGFNFADADELPEVRRPKPRVGLDIERLINIRELREQTGYSGALSQAWLLGQNPDSRYNAMRLSTDNAKELGFSVQVWKPGNESAASKRFGDLYAQSFGGKKIKGVATDAFSASHHNIHELGFFDKTRRAAVLLSCSQKVCSQEQLQSIALTIQRRL